MQPSCAQQPAVSVVVPVYNPGEGIRRCIESLRNQTLSEIEIIFVDDCGADGAMDVVRSASEQDERIRIVANPENLGAGPARNAGIEAARGEYLSFVDPDDYMLEDFLELLYAKAAGGGLDIAKGVIEAVREDDSLCESDAQQLEDILRGLDEGQPVFYLFRDKHTSALYRRGMLLDSGARYGNTRYGEDTTFLIRTGVAATSMGVERRAVYRYIMRPASAVHAFDAARLDEELSALRDQLGCLAAHPEFGDYTAEVAGARIHRNLQICAHAQRDEGLRLAAEGYLSAITGEARALPFIDRVKRQLPSIAALVDYGACLPIVPYRAVGESYPRGERAATVAGWAAYAFAHPGSKAAWVGLGGALVLCSLPIRAQRGLQRILKRWRGR